MKILNGGDKMKSGFLRYFPFVLILALLPFMLAYDSVMYLVTRPSCLNCGSLGEFLKSSSMSVMVVGNYVGELGFGGYSFGKKK